MSPLIIVILKIPLFSNFTQEDYVNAGKFAMSHANEADYYAQKFGDTFMNSQ